MPHCSIEDRCLDEIRYECPDCGRMHALPEDEAFADLVAEACVSVDASTQQTYDAFGIATCGGRWDVDRERALIWWTHSDGRIVRADYQFVGGWIEHSGSWMWAWAHPQATNANRVATERLREFGKYHDYKALIARQLVIDANEAWHMTKLTAWHGSMPGVYRAKVNDVAWAYFAYSLPAWENAA